jgi:FkbM family methyltransferase
MVERSLGEPPFGRLRLPPSVELLRNAANKMQDGAMSRRLLSVVRRLCLVGRPDPFDVDVFHGGRVRLYPRSNRCEKRVFLGVNSWDALERAEIEAEMKNAPPGRPFAFVDGGANVGLYSLFVQGEARRLNRACKIIAIEPDPQNLGRLRFNMEASGASAVSIVPVALGERPGHSTLVTTHTNRGEVRLAANEQEAKGGTPVEVRPLAAILTEAGLSHVDVLKLDIEGFELPVLRGFFKDAPRSLWPRLIILETGRGDEATRAMTRCLDAGYVLRSRARLNAILHLEGQGHAPSVQANIGSR